LVQKLQNNKCEYHLVKGFSTIPKAKQGASCLKRVMEQAPPKQTNKQTPILIHRRSLFLKPIEMKEFNQNKASRAENNNFFFTASNRY
jgi:hypothetical protein